MANGMMRRNLEARRDLWGCPPCPMWLIGRRRHGHHAGAFPWFPLAPMAFVAAMLLSRSLGSLGPSIGVVFGAALVMAGLAVFLNLTWRSGVRSRRAPEESIRFAFTRGQVTRQQYQDALVGVLKDRFVRGVIGLDEYERQVAAVFSGQDLEAAERRQDDPTLL